MGWTFVPETDAEKELAARGYCEDYPCCGHTSDGPCRPQYYDAPGYYDTTIRGNEHALCEHEFGFCDVWEDEDEESDMCRECGEYDGEHDRCCSENVESAGVLDPDDYL